MTYVANLSTFTDWVLNNPHSVKMGSGQAVPRSETTNDGVVSSVFSFVSIEIRYFGEGSDYTFVPLPLIMYLFPFGVVPLTNVIFDYWDYV